MNNVIFITGMSGSGKSTISRGVAEHFSQAMHIDVDQLRQMMVTGRAKPSVRPEVVTEEWVKQLQLARSTATYMANLYASQRVEVVIDDFCWPPNSLNTMRPYLKIQPYTGF
jgi:adenylate kinase family enzyme